MHKRLLVIQDIFPPEKQHFMLTGLRQQTQKPAPVRGEPVAVVWESFRMILCHNTASVFVPKSISKVHILSRLKLVTVQPVKINIQHQRVSGSISSNMDPPFPIELSPLGRSLLCWVIKYWQECGYTMNVEQGVDRGGFCSQQQRRLMVHESLQLFPWGGRNTHITPSIRKHVRFMFHSNGLHLSTAGSQPERGRRA